jgi:chemotaxis response regulator CheB
MNSATRGHRLRALVVDVPGTQRSGLIDVLHAEGDIVVVGQPDNATDAIAGILDVRPDVVVLDLKLEPAARFCSRSSTDPARTPTPILILSGRLDDRQSPSAVQALVAGALEACPGRVSGHRNVPPSSGGQSASSVPCT